MVNTITSGSISSLSADGVYLQVVPPVSTASGSAVNTVGIVGTASYGPVGSPTLCGSYSAYAATFGGINAASITNAHDMATDAYIVGLEAQGAQVAVSIMGVRVTDGTDAAATLILNDTATQPGATLTAKYTGSAGNSFTLTISAGARTGVFNATLSPVGLGVAESYLNLPGTTFWSSLVAAINNGNTIFGGPSNYVTAVAAASTAAPALGTFTFAGGSDGATGVTSAMLLGDPVAETGIYAFADLTGDQAVRVAWISGLTDTSVAAALQANAEAQMLPTLFARPQGETTTASLTTASTLGIASAFVAYTSGDWNAFFDQNNNVQRYVSQNASIGGRIAALGPQESPSNKQVYSVTGKLRKTKYTNAEIGQLESAGILFICNPIPGGSVFGIRHGLTTSLNQVEAPFEYGCMTAFLARLAVQLNGQFIGQLQSQQATDPLRANVEALHNAQLTTLVQLAQIDAFAVIINFSANGPEGEGNNNATSVAAHRLYVMWQVRYLSSVRFFIQTLAGGTTVQVAA